MQQQYLSNPELNVPEFLFHAFNAIMTTHCNSFLTIICSKNFRYRQFLFLTTDQSEGIFRVNSSIPKLQALKQQIDQHGIDLPF
jgi:hypothetical protein